MPRSGIIIPGLVTLLATGSSLLGGCGTLLLVTRHTDPSVMLAVITAAALVAVPIVGRALIRIDSRSKLGWLLALAGTATIVKLVLDAYARAAFIDHVSLPHPAIAELLSSMASSGQLALAGLGPLLLTGALPVGRRWKACAAGTGAIMALSIACAFTPTFGHFDQVPNPAGIGGLGGQTLEFLSVIVILGQNVVDVGAALSVGAAIGQLPANAPPSTRQALVLLHRAAWLVAASFLSCLVLGSIGLATIAYIFEHAALLVLAICSWVVIRRYGLIDSHQVLERTIRYGLLTGVVVAAYVAVVALVREQTEGRVPDLVAVAVAALLGLLLRDVAQRHVARLIWGPASDSGAAFERLGEQLAAAARPDDVLTVTARTLVESLALARAHVLNAERSVVAAWGCGVGGRVFAFPLTFAGTEVGMLMLTQRPGESSLSGRQRTLLSGVIPQLAAAVQAVAAGDALAASQRRLTSLRDSERHRIRRDLHDGLGPTLAGIAWGIERAREEVTRDPVAAYGALDQLATEARRVVSDVRRLVHDLIPTRLEDLGLIAALERDAEALGASVEVSLECRRLTLTSAVELAAYRIALEATTNATRHADAASITVRLDMTADAALLVEVADDGRGISASAITGVGLASMRQRAIECGGTLVINDATPTGTIVKAMLPAGSPGIALQPRPVLVDSILKPA